MNERIKEIARHAGIPNNILISTHTEKSIKKFAELIVKECVAQCDKHYAGFIGSYASANNTAIGRCKQSILEHFGVEE